jgi:type II secretory pathway pseudopilin PulG
VGPWGSAATDTQLPPASVDPAMHPTHPKSAFMLVELLTVIAIIALLVALLLPAVQGTREAARRVQCGTNIRQVALALQHYAAAMKALPRGVANKNTAANPRCNAAYLGGTPDTWAAEIMPRMELGNLHDAFNFSKPVQDPANEALALEPVAGLVCPSDPQASQPILGNRCTINRNSIGGRAHGLITTAFP